MQSDVQATVGSRRSWEQDSWEHGSKQEQTTVGSMDEIEIPSPIAEDDQLLAVNEALEKFALLDPRKAELVKLRYFVGMNYEEAAAALGIAVPTAKQWWAPEVGAILFAGGMRMNECMNLNAPDSHGQQHREEALFAAALERPAEERSAFLDGACHGDPVLRQRLNALIEVHERPATELAEAGAPTVKGDFGIREIDEAVGQTLGRYKILEKVGEGGCGVVYVAEQTEPVRRRVAIKVIKLGMDTKQVVARFEAERQALAMMDHPNIAKVLDAGTVDFAESQISNFNSEIQRGRPYFVMELVRGIPITDYCDQHNLSTKERLDLFIKVCQAIQHAHQKGIIHRDIKPSNILVTLHDGVPVPKVIDFGIAKATEGRLTDNTVYTQLHQFIGTPAYMSPEQAEMSGLDIDTRSDIYSLGVLLYELLAGSTPFDAKELMASGIDQMRKTIREKEPVRPSTRLATLQGEELSTTAKRRSADTSKLLHQLKGDLDWIAMKCLEKDRTRRYETANGLAADLKRHLNHEPVVARPPSAAYKFQKAWRRNKMIYSAGLVIALALSFGIGLSLDQAARARMERNKAVEAAQREAAQRLEAEAQRKLAETAEKSAEAARQLALTSEQSARRLLYAADMALAQQSLKLNNLGRAQRLLERHRPEPGQDDLRGWEWRYLWQLTRSSALVTLTKRPVRGLSVSFSRDGRRLAVGWAGGRVDVFDVTARRLFRTLSDPDARYEGRVAFASGGQLLAATSGPRTVTLHNLEAGTESVLWQAPFEGRIRVRSISFSRDGSKAAIYCGTENFGGEDHVWVVDVAKAEIEHHFPTFSSVDAHFGDAQFSPDGGRLYLARSDAANTRCAIECFDLRDKSSVWRSEWVSDRGLSSLSVSPDGRLIAFCSGFEDPTVRILSAAGGEEVRQLHGHTAWVCKLAFSEDSKRLLSAASDQTLRIWETTGWTEIKVLRGHTDEVHSADLSASQQLLASVSKDGDLMLWQDDAGASSDGYRSFGPPSILIRPLGASRALETQPGKPPRILDLKHGTHPVSLDALANSSALLAILENRIFCAWNGSNRIVVRELRGRELMDAGELPLESNGRPLGLAFAPSQKLFAWAETGLSNRVFLATIERPDSRTVWINRNGTMTSFLFSDDGELLAGRQQDAFSLWNVRTGQPILESGRHTTGWGFAGHEKFVALHPDGNNHEIAFYNLAAPESLPVRFPGRFFAQSLSISTDGELVAVADGSGLIRVFRASTAELTASVHGHLNAIFDIAFSPDGRRLISTSGGSEVVKLWDVETLQELLSLKGRGSILSFAAWSPEADIIFAGAPFQCWRAPSWEEIAEAERK
jgi:eukaryotic-like serine/threonine-protein kinase